MFTAPVIFLFYSYGIPLFLINLRTFYVIWKNPGSRYSSSYLRIFSYTVFNDCLLYLANNYSLRFPSIEPLYDAFFYQFTEFSWYNSPIYFIRRYCSYFVCFSNFLLALNRLTIVWKYVEHERLWERYKPLWMLFMFGGTFICSGQELFNLTRFETARTGNMTLNQLVSNNQFNPINSPTFAAPFIMASTICGVSLGISAYFVWQKRKMTIPKNYRNFEMRLIILTLSFYGLGFLVSIYHRVKAVLFEDDVQQQISYIVISDIVALFPSVVFLSTSSLLREGVFPEEFRQRIWSMYMFSTCQKASSDSQTSTHQISSEGNNQIGAVSTIPRPVISLNSNSSSHSYVHSSINSTRAIHPLNTIP